MIDDIKTSNQNGGKPISASQPVADAANSKLATNKISKESAEKHQQKLEFIRNFVENGIPKDQQDEARNSKPEMTYQEIPILNVDMESGSTQQKSETYSNSGTDSLPDYLYGDAYYYDYGESVNENSSNNSGNSGNHLTDLTQIPDMFRDDFASLMNKLQELKSETDLHSDDLKTITKILNIYNNETKKNVEKYLFLFNVLKITDYKVKYLDGKMAKDAITVDSNIRNLYGMMDRLLRFLPKEFVNQVLGKEEVRPQESSSGSNTNAVEKAVVDQNGALPLIDIA